MFNMLYKFHIAKVKSIELSSWLSLIINCFKGQTNMTDTLLIEFN